MKWLKLQSNKHCIFLRQGRNFFKETKKKIRSIFFVDKTKTFCSADCSSVSSHQCVANIRILQYIPIFIDKYIHLPKYSLIFWKQIYSDFHSILIFHHEYIWTFIRTVRFQQIYLIVFAQQNISCYATNDTHFDLFFINFDML